MDTERIWHEQYVKRSDRRGQHSIRVNAQWRICFIWRDGGAEDVELVDYH